MSNDLNAVHLIGRLGKEPESRSTAGGTPVANFSIAVGKSWKDKESGEKKEQTNWINIVAWNKLAEICAEYLHKGSRVYIGGELQVRKWRDNEGNDRWSTEIVANHMQMLDSKPTGERQERADQAGGGGSTPQTDGFEDKDIPFITMHSVL